MDETYIKVKGTYKYLYRAIDKEGNTINFLLTDKRDKAAVMRFFKKAINNSDMPGKAAMDKSGANKSAIDEFNANREKPIVVRQIKYHKILWNKTIGQ